MKKKCAVMLALGLIAYQSVNAMSCENNNECIQNNITYLPVKKVSSLDDLDEKDKFMLSPSISENKKVETGKVVDRRLDISSTSLEKIELPLIETPNVKQDNSVVSEKSIDKKNIESNEIDYTKNPPAMSLHTKDIDKLINETTKKKEVVKDDKAKTTPVKSTNKVKANEATKKKEVVKDNKAKTAPVKSTSKVKANETTKKKEVVKDNKANKAKTAPVKSTVKAKANEATKKKEVVKDNKAKTTPVKSTSKVKANEKK